MSNGARWRLKPPAPRLFTPPFVQSQIQENSKAPRHWPLYRWLNFPHKGPVTRKMFPFDDVVMPCFLPYLYGWRSWHWCNRMSFPLSVKFPCMIRILSHAWVWNRRICRCVIVRPRSHMLIVKKKYNNKIFQLLGVSNVACCFLMSFNTFPNV